MKLEINVAKNHSRQSDRHSQICDCQNSINDKFVLDNVCDWMLISRHANMQDEKLCMCRVSSETQSVWDLIQSKNIVAFERGKMQTSQSTTSVPEGRLMLTFLSSNLSICFAFMPLVPFKFCIPSWSSHICLCPLLAIYQHILWVDTYTNHYLSPGSLSITSEHFYCSHFKCCLLLTEFSRICTTTTTILLIADLT